MSNSLTSDHRGLDLKLIADDIDRVFGFASNWESSEGTGGGSWEYEGRIMIDLSAIDKLCHDVGVGPADIAVVFRYVFAHLKAHRYQELNPTYSKTYLEDFRPYELEADLVAGWVCADARIPNAFRIHGMASGFNDLSRRELFNGAAEPKVNVKPDDYPWPEEREHAYQRGARMWAAGQVSTYNSATTKQGIPDESFKEFLEQVPAVVNTMWSRPVPQAA